MKIRMRSVEIAAGSAWRGAHVQAAELTNRDWARGLRGGPEGLDDAVGSSIASSQRRPRTPVRRSGLPLIRYLSVCPSSSSIAMKVRSPRPFLPITLQIGLVLLINIGMATALKILTP